MLEKLKEEVCRANLQLPKYELVTFTWGNVSGIDREKGLFVIKPSGVSYEELKPEHMVVMDLEGNKVEGDLNPSTDTATHLELYRRFPEIGGVTHTHSVHAVSFAQAGMAIPALGTTHADYFYGDVPCTRELTAEEVAQAYEVNTGKVIVEKLSQSSAGVMAVPAILVKNHGPFTWGRDAAESVYHAVVLETVAQMAANTLALNRGASLAQYVLDKHYFRKHGENAYYGQKNG